MRVRCSDKPCHKIFEVAKCRDKTSVQQAILPEASPIDDISLSTRRRYNITPVADLGGLPMVAILNIIAASMRCPQRLLSDHYEYSSAISFVFYCNHTEINDLVNSFLRYCYKSMANVATLRLRGFVFSFLTDPTA